MTLEPVEPVYRGGCQCGAVRFHIKGALGQASICHCRMCQKAFGSFYAPLVSVDQTHLVWTRREPKRFQSSNHVKRGFCGECGTPLTYEAPDGIALAIGAFDEPEKIAPVIAFGQEGKLSYVEGLASLPERSSLDDAETVDFLKRLVSFQHPDHDTDCWPEK